MFYTSISLQFAHTHSHSLFPFSRPTGLLPPNNSPSSLCHLYKSGFPHKRETFNICLSPHHHHLLFPHITFSSTSMSYINFLDLDSVYKRKHTIFVVNLAYSV